MPRTPMIAGNWKMNTLRTEALELVHRLRERTDGIAGVDKLVCPPYVFLHEVGAALRGSTIRVGAQNL
jgi:triosephosphate isomerase